MTALLLVLTMILALPQVNQTIEVKAAGTVTAASIVAYAKQWEGITFYKWGGCSLINGADCSGYVCAILEGFAQQCGWNTKDLWNYKGYLRGMADTYLATNVGTNINDALIGDIITLYVKGSSIKHCGFYVGDGKVITNESENPKTHKSGPKISKVTDWNGIVAITRMNGLRYDSNEIVYPANGIQPGGSSNTGGTTTISVGVSNADNITDSTAVVHGFVSKPKNVSVKACGIYLGTSSDHLTKRNTEQPSAGANAMSTFNVWYDLKAELGIVLSPGTTYYYQFYCISPEGTEYKSSVAEFTTTGQIVTEVKRGFRILVPANYGIVQGYQDYNLTKKVRYFHNSDSSYYITGYKYIDLQGGGRRYFVQVGPDQLWIDGSGSFSYYYYADSIEIGFRQIDLPLGMAYKIKGSVFPSDANEPIVASSGDRSCIISKWDNKEGCLWLIAGEELGQTTITLKGEYSGRSITLLANLIDANNPEIGNLEIEEIDTGFHVKALINDNYQLKSVGYQIWHESDNGKEDIPIHWVDIMEEDCSEKNVDYNVNIADYGNKTGVYNVMLYVKDTSDNQSSIMQYVTVAPKEKINLSAENITTGIMLKWNKISDANGYKVLKKSSDEDVWKEIGSVTGNIFMDSDVYDQSSYLYAVKPYIEVEDDFGLVCQETNEIGVQMAELEKPIIRKDETTETPGTPQKPTQSSENDKKPSSGGQTETNVPKTTLKNQKIFYKRVKSYKAKQLKKKQVKFSLKARTTGDGKLTYKISKYPKKCKKYISVSNKGIVTLKKGIKKGTYGITVTASKTKKYTKAQKSIIIKIK